MKQTKVPSGRRRPAAAVRELRLTPLMLSLVCLGVTPALAQTLPTGFSQAAGEVSASRSGAVMTINQGTQRAIAQWQTFSIGSGGTVNVAQPSSSSVLLNRVTGNELSTIAGSLNANGHVYLVNPNGVLFSPTSSVNVGGLVASTLGITNDNFMAGKQLVFTRDDGNTATVVNQGSITAASGGLVALMGAQAINEGTINVARGTAALVSANKVTVDFEGDGLTRFTIPADSKATAALVRNSGAITADGGRIALLAASEAKAQVVNQSGVLQARTLEQRNGEIILGAGLTTDSSTNASVYSPNAMRVSGTIDAGGGQVRMYSGQDITVTNLPPYAADSKVATTAADSGSIVNADALSYALGHASSVTLESAAIQALPDATPASAMDSFSAGNGVRFESDTQVLKSQGGSATLAVNSARNIIMESGSSLASSNGALNIDFNADAKGTLAVDGRAGGAIAMDRASIQSNGGNIRFYGQGDPVNGRAAGGAQSGPYAKGNGLDLEGIRLADSLVSTCAPGQESCGGGGSISLRGQGGTVQPSEGSIGNSGVGIALYGSTLQTGSGTIAVDGLGGIGASGVISDFTEGGNTAIESRTGDIRITGRTRDWSGNDLVLYRSVDASLGDIDFGGGNGITLLNTRITTGGGVVLDGTGADLSAALSANSGFAPTGIVGASNGVLINDTSISAGAGRQVSVTGTAGSNGFTVSLSPAEVPIVTPDTSTAAGVAVNASFGRGAISAEGGSISIQGRGGSDVYLNYTGDSETGPLTLLDVSSGSRAGGSIDIGGRNILMTNGFGPTANFLDASGAGSGGGSISVRATGAIAIDGNSGMAADALSATGNGGTIHVVAADSLRSHGSYSARGGAQGGNGGLVETSASNLDLSGVRVDAAAPAGTAGKWLVDPFNVTIVDGAATGGGLPSNPFVPLADSTIQDGDIEAALNGGTSVTIGTGAPDPLSTAGNINFGTGAGITYTGAGAVTFRLEAARSINAFGNTIQSTGGPLNVQFVAGLSNATGSINYSGGQILTGGGSVEMTALGNGFVSCAICLNTAQIDTRGAAGGGSVTLTVPAPGSAASSGTFTTAAINLSSTDITTGSGDVNISGYSQNGTGVRLEGTLFSVEGGRGVINTTSGDINITGVGAFSSNSTDGFGHGVVMNNAGLFSQDGNIAVRALRQAGTQPGVGVLMQNGARIATTGSGDIEVTGESLGNGGVGLATTAGITDPQLGNTPPATIDGNRNVVLRASNNGVADAIVLNGTVRAGQVLNLRPGGVDISTGAGVDRTADPIYLMGNPPPPPPPVFTEALFLAPPAPSTSSIGGYWISTDEMSRLTAGTMVVGGSTHAGTIQVLETLASGVPLTLQNNAGGGINIWAPLSAPTLGLISGGDIAQAAGASITAGTLLARSFGGNVILSDPGNNVSSTTLGGGAAGRFEFINSGPLRVGPVSVIGYDSAGNLPQVQSATSMAADTVLIRTLAGELILDTSVTSANGADLVAATIFQNAGGASLGGAPWRVWADTWVGEARGGLVGSGQLPNLYHCAYLGACAVTVTPGDNHFIYAQQPSLTVNIGSFARPVGVPNPNFTYTLAGLILGDTGAGISGSMSTPANLQSPAGLYPVFGTFTSAEGYALSVVNGQLLVASVLPQPARFVDVLREEPTTYLYDRNIGQAPICLATGPLDGERAQQGNDILAREWSRVRTRPNLTSCVDTERSNGCGDF